MKRWVLFCSLAAGAAGCATGPTLEQRMLPLVGRSEGDVVQALGAPERTYQADDGRKFLTFEERRSYLVAGDPFLYRGFRYGPYFAPSSYVVRVCEITFTFRGGRAEGFALRGDGCR